MLYFMTVWNIMYTANWYHLWSFGIVCGLFGIFFPFWYVQTKKNLATLLQNLVPREDFIVCINRPLNRVARWYICIPKIPNWVYFGGSWNKKFRLVWPLFLVLFFNFLNFLTNPIRP
jgi:hypothetical protein